MENDQLLPDTEPETLSVDQQIRRRTLKAFAGFALASLVPVGIWKALSAKPLDQGLPTALRSILNTNEQVSVALFSDQHLAPTYPVSQAAKQVRTNGSVGLRSALDPDAWQLTINQPGKSMTLNLDAIKALPKHELVFDFKCVEGWSQVQHWAGARLSDLIEAHNLGTRTGKRPTGQADYYGHVGMETPDKAYYVGLDIASAMHPQTLLAYEMNGAPLTAPHGAPMRLIIPVKYGVKNLKRIGSITFADERPRDYWAERGYDYYVGL